MRDQSKEESHWVRERWIGMPCRERGYFFSGLWRGQGNGEGEKKEEQSRESERETEREKERDREKKREKDHLYGEEMCSASLDYLASLLFLKIKFSTRKV